MKKIKIVTIVAIVIFTVGAIAYLIFHAEKMEKYTLSKNDGGICFVVYSSSGGSFKDGVIINEILKYTSNFAISAGCNAINLGVKSSLSPEKLREELLNNMKQGKKYILLDINLSKLVVNKNTALLRLGNKNNPKFQENFGYADAIKSNIKDKSTKINIIIDHKDNHNQDMGYRAIRLEIADKNTYEDAKAVLSKIIEAMVK
jgi:hypothetical protein